MTEMICAGFGGQGILTTGMLFIHAGMKQGKNVIFYPSYGSEMRGGTANCTVIISDKKTHLWVKLFGDSGLQVSKFRVSEF